MGAGRGLRSIPLTWKAQLIFLLVLTMWGACRPIQTPPGRAIFQISEQIFDYELDTCQAEDLGSFASKGFIVLKVRSSEEYFAHDPYGDFECFDSADLNFFVNHRDQFAKVKRSTVGVSIYYGLIPEGVHFPDSTFSRIAELGKVIGTPLPMGRKLKPNCLQLVDAYFDSLGFQEAFRKRYYISMLALLGEKIIQDYPGHCHWHEKLDEDDSVTWEPDVFYDRKWLAVGSRLYEWLFESIDVHPMQDTWEVAHPIIEINIKGRKRR